MILVGGIDEAGLGPLLGPLCMGACGLLVPTVERADARLWDVLAEAVSRDVKRDKERLVVDDSKRVYSRNDRGRRRLETTVLCFARAGGGAVSAIEDLALGGDDEARWLARYPWRDGAPIAAPTWISPDFVELRAAPLERALEQHDVRIALLGVRSVEPGELNAAMDASGNKSRAAWEFAAHDLRLLLERAIAAGAERADITIDRQGGRAHYGPQLARALPVGFTVHLVEETEGVSRYRLTGPIEARITIAEKAELGSFTTALASCAAKYVRERSMQALNDWFAERIDGLAPTAGYTTDGRRWLNDVATRAPGVLAELDRDLVVRRR
ncbi:Hypothetical protein Pla163_16960 [Planctomycetes bacterium Pla163]|uniref:Uncharacterized protein n=1 Tax=Rohdeia mirabilis TaxID=2528008 RepID=A0A518CZG1_9BACT|nr:Hypothetical protein Pla163_16960 [Planctomycetes bacterium Pla163]